ncbi:MAG: signal peptidase I [Bdellovibrionales bacterium]|nr:signal peptidase I [Bdellovibrionales bacterium]
MNEPHKKTLRQNLKGSLPLMYLIVGLLALRWTIVEPYVVPTGSMEPTLKKGDRLYALKCAYDVRFPFTDVVLFRTREVKRGDVILFRNPKDTSITFVKRVVGIPGDEISFVDGTLYLNGQAVEKVLAPDRGLMYDIDNEEFKRLFIETLGDVRHWVILNDLAPNERNYHKFLVPPDSYFAVGDNRDNSHDSRAWGLVPYALLKGQAMFIWYSSYDWTPRPERIGTLIQ